MGGPELAVKDRPMVTLKVGRIGHSFAANGLTLWVVSPERFRPG